METEKAPTEVVDQVESFQRMIDTEKTLFFRSAATAPVADDPVITMIAALNEHGIVVRDFAFPADDVRHRGSHAEYRRRWEQQEKERVAREEQEAQSSEMDDPPVRVSALYDYAGTELGHLAFKAGDVIAITQNFSNGHLLGTLNGRTGLLPESYVRLLGKDDAPAAATDATNPR